MTTATTTTPPATPGEAGERFAQLRGYGLSVANAAAVLGITPQAAGHYAAQLRAQQQRVALEAVLDLPIAWPVPAPPRLPVTRWQDRAACRGHEDLFFAPDGTPGVHESAVDREIREAKAKSLCAACPVRRECGEFREQEGLKDGIWAGKSDDDREQEKRDQRNAKRRVAGRRQEDGLAEAS